MDLSGVPTPKFEWDSTNLPDQWRKFKSHVELIFNGPLKEKSEAVKVNYLLLWIGDKGREIRNTWTDLDEEEQTEARSKLKTYYDRFQAHVQPKLNPIFARYKFNNEIQGAATVEQFLTKLRTVVKDCSYTNPEEMIRDRIVFGTSSAKVREKLINEGEKLTLDRAITIAQSYEYSQQQLKTMAQQTQSVNEVKKREIQSRFARKEKQRPQVPAQKSRTNGPCTRGHECSRCGTKHSNSSICPAKGKQCSSCKKFNHFAKKCLSKKGNVHQIEVDTRLSDESEDDFFIDCIDSPVGDNQAFYTLLIGPEQTPVRFKLDTGSQAQYPPQIHFRNLAFPY